MEQEREKGERGGGGEREEEEEGEGKERGRRGGGYFLPSIKRAILSSVISEVISTPSMRTTLSPSL